MVCVIICEISVFLNEISVICIICDSDKEIFPLLVTFGR